MLVLKCLLIFSLLSIVKGDTKKIEKQNGGAKKSSSESTTELRRKCDQQLQPYQTDVTAYNTDISHNYLPLKPEQILNVRPVFIQSNSNGEALQHNRIHSDNFNNYMQSVFNANNPSHSNIPLQQAQTYAENSNQPQITYQGPPILQTYQNQAGRQPLERYPNDIQNPHPHLIIQFTYPNQPYAEGFKQQEQPYVEPIQQNNNEYGNYIPANYYNKKYVEDYEKHHSRLYNQIMPRPIPPLPEGFRTNHIKQFQNDVNEENNNGPYSNYPVHPHAEGFKMENEDDDIEPISLKYNRALRARRLKRYRALKHGTPDYDYAADKPIRSNRGTNSPDESNFESADHEQLPIGFLNSIRALIRRDALKQNLDHSPAESILQHRKINRVQTSDQPDGEQASSVFLPTYSYVGDPLLSGIGLTYAPSYDFSTLQTLPLQDFHHLPEISSPFTPTFSYGSPVLTSLPVYPSNLGYSLPPVYAINHQASPIIRTPETRHPHPPKKEIHPSHHESGQGTSHHLSEYLASPHFKHAALSLAKGFGISAHQLTKLGLLNSTKEKVLYRLGLYPSKFF